MYDKYYNKYILFFVDNKKRAGHVNKVENGIIFVDSLQINNRSISKIYHYEISESDVLEMIEKNEAIKFANKITYKKIVFNQSLSHLSILIFFNINYK